MFHAGLSTVGTDLTRNENQVLGLLKNPTL